jgi:putative serine protease PepD
MSPATPRSRTTATLVAALVLGVAGGAGAAVAVDGAQPTTTRVITSSQSGPAGGRTVTDVYNRVKQGVVDITAKTQAAAGAGGAGGAFGVPGPSSGSSSAEGSGIVLDKNGDIVTNQHVVSGASQIQVKFADGTSASAKLVGGDASSDIAVIRVSGVDASKLQPLTLADSSKVAAGDSVMAIGSPYGLAQSLTTGVVSATGRDIAAPNRYTIGGAIQTDAPINHGNSGGPLLDAQGNVIGVNSQIESNTGENTGVGFAIPSNTVKSVAEQIISGGKVSHPFLGLQLSDGASGATVTAATAGGAAAKAGVQAGDVVTAIDGQRVTSSAALVSVVQTHRVGDRVTLTVQRSGATHSVVVTLANHPGT